MVTALSSTQTDPLPLVNHSHVLSDLDRRIQALYKSYLITAFICTSYLTLTLAFAPQFSTICLSQIALTGIAALVTLIYKNSQINSFQQHSLEEIESQTFNGFYLSLNPSDRSQVIHSLRNLPLSTVLQVSDQCDEEVLNEALTNITRSHSSETTLSTLNQIEIQNLARLVHQDSYQIERLFQSFDESEDPTPYGIFLNALSAEEIYTFILNDNSIHNNKVHTLLNYELALTVCFKVLYREEGMSQRAQDCAIRCMKEDTRRTMVALLNPPIDREGSLSPCQSILTNTSPASLLFFYQIIEHCATPVSYRLFIKEFESHEQIQTSLLFYTLRNKFTYFSFSFSIVNWENIYPFLYARMMAHVVEHNLPLEECSDLFAPLEGLETLEEDRRNFLLRPLSAPISGPITTLDNVITSTTSVALIPHLSLSHLYFALRDNSTESIFHGEVMDFLMLAPESSYSIYPIAQFLSLHRSDALRPFHFNHQPFPSFLPPNSYRRRIINNLPAEVYSDLESLRRAQNHIHTMVDEVTVIDYHAIFRHDIDTLSPDEIQLLQSRYIYYNSLLAYAFTELTRITFLLAYHGSDTPDRYLASCAARLFDLYFITHTRSEIHNPITFPRDSPCETISPDKTIDPLLHNPFPVNTPLHARFCRSQHSFLLSAADLLCIGLDLNWTQYIKQLQILIDGDYYFETLHYTFEHIRTITSNSIVPLLLIDSPDSKNCFNMLCSELNTAYDIRLEIDSYCGSTSTEHLHPIDRSTPAPPKAL